MPPIELFAGLDAVRTSADVVPGLPTREELKEWLVEHDKIEKETEAFDSGELKKFKQFTKGECQRLQSCHSCLESTLSSQLQPSAISPRRIRTSSS